MCASLSVRVGTQGYLWTNGELGMQGPSFFVNGGLKGDLKLRTHKRRGKKGNGLFPKFSFLSIYAMCTSIRDMPN